MIALEGQVDPPGRHHHPDSQSSPLSIGLVALALRQFDVRLDSIDVVSLGLGAQDRRRQQRC